MKTAIDLIRESNLIEGIDRDPTDAEIAEFHRFMALDEVAVADLEQFLSVYQPDARLRVNEGDDVMVGNHFPPVGGRAIRWQLGVTLRLACATVTNNPWSIHLSYEHLHPFTDGNGRSGRMLWFWMMKDRAFARGFLHAFYYQALADSATIFRFNKLKPI